MLPVRKIGRSHSSLRAVHPSTKTGRLIQLESALERDFCCLLEFAPDITNYLEQPLTIEYELEGRTRRYTPDFLVHYVNERPSVLAEIKYKVDLQTNWAQLKHKFRAAKCYAAAAGWEFRVYTEVEIQTPYLLNAKLLLRFKDPHFPVCSEYRQLLLELVAKLNESTPAELVLTASPDADIQAKLLPVLWHLVSRGLIGCNLFQSLTMQSQVWSTTHPSSLL